MTILCLDPGLSHTGVAIANQSFLALPLSTIESKSLKHLVVSLNSIITQYHPQIVVIGQPRSGPIVRFSQNLHRSLSTNFPTIKFVLYSEDNSSHQASSELARANVSPRHHKSSLHANSAAIILEEYLDSKK